MSTDDDGYKIALQEAILGAAEGGLPVGACIVSKDGKILGRGRNTWIQTGSVILHAETAAFESDRLYPKAAFKDCTLYTTLSPCPMCAGAAIWFEVKRVVIGDGVSFTGPEGLLREKRIEVLRLDTAECIQLMEKFKARSPAEWDGEVGAGRR